MSVLFYIVFQSIACPRARMPEASGCALMLPRRAARPPPGESPRPGRPPSPTRVPDWGPNRFYARTRVRGFRQLDGLAIPEEVRLATEEYRSNEDVLGAFLQERCVLGSAFNVKVGELYDAYRAWSEAAGEKYIPKRSEFNRSLEDRGYTNTQRTGGYYWWAGIGLKAKDREEATS